MKIHQSNYYLLTLAIVLMSTATFAQRGPAPGGRGVPRGAVPGGAGGRPPLRRGDFAAPGRADEAERVEIREIELSGVIQEFRNDGLILLADGQAYEVDLVHNGINIPPPRILFDREEDLRFLAPGMIIRFEAEMKRGDVEGEMSTLEVVGHVDRRPLPPLGLTQIHDVDADKDAEVAAPRQGQETGRFQIVGRFKRNTRNRLLIEVPDRARPEEWRTLGVLVSREANVKLASMIFANVGEAIDVKGVEPVREVSLFLYATDVRVKSAEKSGSPRKKGPGARKAAASDRPALGRRASTPGTILEIN